MKKLTKKTSNKKTTAKSKTIVKVRSAESNFYKISGQTTNADGTPVQNIAITVSYIGIQKQEQLASTITNAEGKYELIFELDKRADMEEKNL